MKGAIKGISNNEITDSDVATNLALLTTSNSQFWAPLLDQTKEVLALTLDKKDDTKKFGDILLEGSKKLKESAKFYRFSVSPTNSLKSDLLRNLESPGAVTIALEELKKLILYENIKNGADGIEISKDLFLGNNNEFAANGSLTSPIACNLLNEAMKQLYFMGEESRVAEGLFSSRNYLPLIAQNLLGCYKELLEFPPNRVATRKASASRVCVHHAIQDVVESYEMMDRIAILIKNSKKLSNKMSVAMNGISIRVADIEALHFLEVAYHNNLETMGQRGESKSKDNQKDNQHDNSDKNLDNLGNQQGKNSDNQGKKIDNLGKNADNQGKNFDGNVACNLATRKSSDAREAAFRSMTTALEAEKLIRLECGSRVLMKDIKRGKDYSGVITQVNTNNDIWGDERPTYSVSLDCFRKEKNVQYVHLREENDEDDSAYDRAAGLILQASIDTDIAYTAAREAATAAIHSCKATVTLGIKLEAKLQAAIALVNASVISWEQSLAEEITLSKLSEVSRPALVLLTKQSVRCAVIFALEKACSFASYLSSELAAYAENGDPSYNKQVKCLSAVLKAIPGLNIRNKLKFNDQDFECILDALLEIKQAFNEDDPDLQLAALKVYVGTALMRIPSCSEAGRALRNATWGQKKVSEKLNAQDWCDEVMNNFYCLFVGYHHYIRHFFLFMDNRWTICVR